MAGRFGAIGSNLSVGAGQSVRRNAADDGFEAYTPSAGDMSDLVDDTTPQLGGDLDANGHAIVAADHGTASTAQVGNICYGTSATPPTASTTPEGTLYIQYTA